MSLSFSRHVSCLLQSKGDFLCFIDADDQMLPQRIEKQLTLSLRFPHSLIGCNFVRIPPESTTRYAEWCNGLTDTQLLTHRFKECTIIQPTWFMPRAHFYSVGEYAHDRAEDLRFFYSHFKQWLDTNQSVPPVLKVHEALVRYQYTETSVSSFVPKAMMIALRAQALEEQVLNKEPWKRGFGIWGAGKNGRGLYRQLSEDVRALVTAFYDIDPHKV
jgi:hypothetical protein